MRQSLATIAAYLGLVVPESHAATSVAKYSVDSREDLNEALFVALAGEHTDGHNFVAAAFDKGAAAALVSREVPNIPGPQLVVPDVLAALQSLARQARAHWGKIVLALTGSAGKTSTKDAVACLLSAAFPVSKTTGNFNNHIGLPLSVLRIEDASQAAVLEMGMNHAGEIAALCAIAQPNLGLVTNVGYAHIENFPDGIAGIAAAKRELILGLPAGATAILNADDPRVARFADGLPLHVETFGLSADARTRATQVEFTLEGARFLIDGQPFVSRFPGRIGVLNITAAVASARLFGVPLRVLAEKVHEIPAAKRRTERIVRDGVQIWNDCYNSNPDAARAMLDVLRDSARAFHPEGRQIAVLGEMLELGPLALPLHSQLGSYAAESGLAVLIGIRGAAQQTVESALKAEMPVRAAFFFEDPTAAGKHLKSLVRPGDSILFKGSRGTRVELALEAFLAEETS
jgi:UDP-N-acetylmuramoyl-tripeptide--D-alanyl-D-alanine ligase